MSRLRLDFWLFFLPESALPFIFVFIIQKKTKQTKKNTKKKQTKKNKQKRMYFCIAIVFSAKRCAAEF